jgi:CRISPR-associated protein Cas6
MSDGPTPLSLAVDLAFPLTAAAGREAILAVDHAYSLFAALCRIIPELHGDRRIGIHPIPGRLIGQRQLRIDRRARLTLRVPPNRIGTFLPLAGQGLNLDGTRLAVGPPDVRALRPWPALRSRLVVIRGFTEPELFVEAARRQLFALAIRGARVRLVPRRAARPWEREGRGGPGPWVRRTVRIRDRQVVGYALDVEDLAPNESILLQAAGIGGRRRFGCGLFLPRRMS